jgi:murein DD-endopeptidase MepM/ murein hydrolase activator NlpD
VEDWFGWSKPIFSPDNGIVIQAEDGWVDRQEVGFVRDFFQFFFLRRAPAKTTDDPRSVAGNFVTIQRPDGIIIFMCHLKTGSIKVKAGDPVNVGDLIGEVGNSGNSLSPHLHLNLFEDINMPLTGKSILKYLTGTQVTPFIFSNFYRQVDNDWVLVQEETPQKGDKIKSVT